MSPYRIGWHQIGMGKPSLRRGMDAGPSQYHIEAITEMNDQPVESTLANLHVEKQNVYEIVFDQLKELILTSQIKPGDRLPTEREIAATLKVSRNSVRTALKLLEFIGLVEIRHGVGLSVPLNLGAKPEAEMELELLKSKSEKPLSDILEIRKVISPFIARLAAARATQSDLDAMEQALKDMERSIQSGGHMIEEISVFYDRMYQATKNVFLFKLGIYFQQLLADSKIMSYNVESNAPLALERHRAILEAIKRKDQESAERMMLEYLEFIGKLHGIPD